MLQSMTLFDEVKSNGRHDNGPFGSRPVKIEDFPSSWKESRFGELVVSSRYGTSQASSEEGVPMLGMGNIGDLGLDLSELSYVDPEEIDLEKYRLEEGDLLFNRTNSPGLVGKTALFDLDFECVCASYLVQFKLDTNQIDPKYAHYFFQTAAAHRQLRALTTRGVSQANINPSHLERDLRVVHPPLEKQNQIIETIDSWDRAIEQVDALIERKQERLHGLRQRLLTGEVRFPEFSEPWRETTLGEYFQYFSNRNGDEHDVPVLSCSKIHDIIPQSEKFEQRVASKDTSSYKVVERGNLVYDPMLLWDASIGFVDCVEQGVVSPAYYTFKFDEENGDRTFFRHLLATHWVKYQYKAISQGTNTRRRKAPRDAFLGIEVEMPSLREQQKIAEVMRAAEAEIDKLTQKRDALEQQKKGLMQCLLTGVVRTI